MKQAFALKQPSGHGHAAGTIVYPCKGSDYGCASDDTRHYGVEHRSMTLDPDGDYPFFTVRADTLEPVVKVSHPAHDMAA